MTATIIREPVDSWAQQTPVAALEQQAARLVPSIRERGRRISETRMLPEDVMRDLHDAGLQELLRPTRFGGVGAGLDDMYRVGRELARADGSTAWVYVVTNSHDSFIALYPEHIQAEYWASSQPLSASSYVPTGKVEPRPGGYLLSGKWSFCSGVDYCGWIVLGAMAGMLDNPKRPDMRFLLIPKSDCTVVDDWHVMGLRGTGSKSVVVDDVFVPDERVLTGDQVFEGTCPGTATSDDPLLRESAWTGFGFCISAPATGIARGAYDALLTEFRGRTERQEPMFMGKKPAVQMHFAEASSLIDASDMAYSRGLTSTFAEINAGRRLTTEMRVRNRLDQAFSVKAARQAAELLFGAAGGRGIAESEHVQRAFRDLYAVSAHPGANWDSPALSFGSFALGTGATEAMF